MTRVWRGGVPTPRVTFGALFALALLVRVGFIAATGDFLLLSDSEDFYRHAESIAAGNGYPESLVAGGGGPSAFRPPGYPYLLGGVFLVFGDGIAIGRLFSALLGALASGLVFLIGRRIWDDRTAIVAGVVSCVFPPLVVAETALLSEPLFLAVMLAAVLAVLELRRSERPLAWALLAGTFCGVAGLTRSNGILLALVLAIGAWHTAPRLSRRSLLPPLALLGATALVMAPWAIRNSTVFDRFVPTNTQAGMALSGTYNELSKNASENEANFDGLRMLEAHDDLFRDPDLEEPELEDKLRARAVDFARDHPRYVVEVMALNLARSLGFLEGRYANTVPIHGGTLLTGGFHLLRWSAVALVLLALAGGIVLARRGRSAWGPLFVWLIPVLMSLSAIVISGDTRYRTPIDPFLAMLGAIALVSLWDWMRRRRPHARAEAA